MSSPVPPPAAPLSFGRFELRPIERVLSVEGRPLPVGARAMDVLLALVERRHRMVSKNELLDVVWAGLVVEENNLQVQISSLRKLLGPQAIATIPGLGYRFAQSVDSPQPDDIPRRAAEKLRTNLPQSLMKMHGREADLLAVGKLVDDHALVSVVGSGGIGKTLLAQHFLASRRNAYAHGICWIELAAITDPASIPAALGAALGIDLSRADPLRGLCAAVEPLEILIALDNAEHLVDAIAHVVKALIAAAPAVRLLVTSQAPLRLAEEWVYRIGPLSVPPEPMSSTEALAYSSVALFVERARASDAGFVLTDDISPAVVEICRRLDGVALAIELAAARVPLLGVKRLAHSMNDRLKLLNATRDREAPSRQQTLRAALEWSRGFLDEREQVVFRRLGVFVGSASLEAIQRVVADGTAGLDEWTAIDALNVLVDRSLLTVVQADRGADPRYRLLESPRAYALEQLESANEGAAMRRRHAVAMAARFEAAYDERFSGSIGVDDWHAALADDLNNAHAALAWAREENETTIELTILAGMFPALGPSFHAGQRGVLAERCEMLDTTNVPLRVLCRVWSALGTIWAIPQPQRSRDAALRAVALARELNRRETDPFTLYRALCLLVRAPLGTGGIEVRAKALQEARALEDPGWPPHRLVQRARSESFFAHLNGDAKEHVRLTRHHILLEQASGNQNSTGHGDLVDAELAAGDAGAAVRDGEALVAALAGTRKEVTLAYARINLAAALLALDHHEKARAVAQAGWPLGLRFDLQPYWADYLSLLAILEARPRAAARLIGYADAGYASRPREREHNEAAAVGRARTLVGAALSNVEFERLRAAGKLLRDEEIPAVAFALEDPP